MKLLRIKINDSAWCVCEIDYIKEFLDNEYEIGDKLEIEIVNLEKQQFNDLSDFTGF